MHVYANLSADIFVNHVRSVALTRNVDHVHETNILENIQIMAVDWDWGEPKTPTAPDAMKENWLALLRQFPRLRTVIFNATSNDSNHEESVARHLHIHGGARQCRSRGNMQWTSLWNWRL